MPHAQCDVISAQNKPARRQQQHHHSQQRLTPEPKFVVVGSRSDYLVIPGPFVVQSRPPTPINSSLLFSNIWSSLPLLSVAFHTADIGISIAIAIESFIVVYSAS